MANNKTSAIDIAYSAADQAASFMRYEFLFRDIFITGLIAAIIAFIFANKLKRMIG